MKQLLFFLLLCFSFSMLNAQPRIKMETEAGILVAELYPEKAPITCRNFMNYIEHKKFKGATFYRTVCMDNQSNYNVKIEVIQGGLGFDRETFPFPPIQHETTKETGIKHTNGTLSMARSKPGTATSEFFICIGDQPELDYGGKRNPDGQGFAAFGKIIEGMDVVKTIQQMPENKQMLTDPVKIYSIKVMDPLE